MSCLSGFFPNFICIPYSLLMNHVHVFIPFSPLSCFVLPLFYLGLSSHMFVVRSPSLFTFLFIICPTLRCPLLLASLVVSCPLTLTCLSSRPSLLTLACFSSIIVFYLALLDLFSCHVSPPFLINNCYIHFHFIE